LNTTVTKVTQISFQKRGSEKKTNKGNLQPSINVVPFISSGTTTKPCSRNHGNVLELFSVGQCQFTAADSLALTSFFLLLCFQPAASCRRILTATLSLPYAHRVLVETQKVTVYGKNKVKLLILLQINR
jgi:hypothetical protein